PVFVQAVGNTILYATVVVAAQITLALVVASLIQPLGPRAHVFYRALFYLPLVNSAILVAMVWRWIFNANPYGLANAALSPFGLGPYLLIGSSDQALIAVILSAVLTIPGGGVVLYSAAMGSLPRELYEAADLDGASWFSKWRHITVPLLRPTTLYLVVVYTILAFQVFDRVYIMTNGGGPNNATITIVQLIYSTAFQSVGPGKPGDGYCPRPDDVLVGRYLSVISPCALPAVPAQVTLIPVFFLLKNLNLLDSYPGIILPGFADVFGVFLMKQYLQTLPRELESAG